MKHCVGLKFLSVFSGKQILYSHLKNTSESLSLLRPLLYKMGVSEEAKLYDL